MQVNDDNQDWVNEKSEYPAGFWEDLPKPLFWRMLIAPVGAVEVTRGGIVIPISAQEAQSYLNHTGKVVALGPTAGKHERLGGDGVNTSPGFPKIGDHITYARYAGQRVTYKGVKLLLLNDDEALTTISNPETMGTNL